MAITLKNMPPALLSRLRASAERNRRSLNDEILLRLEGGFAQAAFEAAAYAADLRAFTTAQPKLNAKLISRFKQAGRV